LDLASSPGGSVSFFGKKLFGESIHASRQAAPSTLWLPRLQETISTYSTLLRICYYNALSKEREFWRAAPEAAVERGAEEFDLLERLKTKW